jgi:hypothetical protein
VKQNLINHVALVLDASSSMHHLREHVIRVADEQISYLARRSEELKQETRITVYVFSSTVKCLVYDMDVLRLPSLREVYRPEGMTALIDATLKSQDDLAQTPELYGDHSFLTFVITDGAENRSRSSAGDLRTRLLNLPDNWTVAVLVPDQVAKREAKQFGFPSENIAIWDSTSTRGLEEGFETIRRATDTFMKSRASGTRGTRSLFSTGADAVNADTIKSANLKPLAKDTYILIPVPSDTPIREFVQKAGYTYRTGRAHYQLMKTETIQGNKELMVVEKSSGRAYSGPDARKIVGLPDMTVRVKPDHNPDFDIFVQSTSTNRKLIAGTRLLLLL